MIRVRFIAIDKADPNCVIERDCNVLGRRNDLSIDVAYAWQPGDTHHERFANLHPSGVVRGLYLHFNSAHRRYTVYNQKDYVLYAYSFAQYPRNPRWLQVWQREALLATLAWLLCSPLPSALTQDVGRLLWWGRAAPPGVWGRGVCE